MTTLSQEEVLVRNDLSTYLKEYWSVGLSNLLARFIEKKGLEYLQELREIRLTPRKVKNLRESLNLTQLDLSKVMDVSLSAVQSWEQGDRGLKKGPAKTLLNFLCELSFVKE